MIIVTRTESNRIRVRVRFKYTRHETHNNHEHRTRDEIKTPKRWRPDGIRASGIHGTGDLSDRSLSIFSNARALHYTIFRLRFVKQFVTKKHGSYRTAFLASRLGTEKNRRQSRSGYHFAG